MSFEEEAKKFTNNLPEIKDINKKKDD